MHLNPYLGQIDFFLIIFIWTKQIIIWFRLLKNKIIIKVKLLRFIKLQLIPQNFFLTRFKLILFSKILPSWMIF